MKGTLPDEALKSAVPCGGYYGWLRFISAAKQAHSQKLTCMI